MKLYKGKICAKHPELKGARTYGSGKCPQCRRDHAKAYRKTDAGKRYMAAYSRSDKRKEYRQGYRASDTYKRVQKKYRNKSDRKARHGIQARIRNKRISKRATPAWADLKKIGAMYERAKSKTEATGKPYVVDHIIPLRGELVCGLHVHNNLRVVLESTNQKKGNTYCVE